MNFKDHLKSYLDNEQIDLLIASLKEDQKYGVLLNPLKMSDEVFLSIFPNVQKHPIVAHAYIYDKKEYDLGKSIYYLQGCFYLQEPSAMIPAFLLNASPNDYVLDMCAAPGGKTIQTAIKMNQTGLVLSNDISRQRSSKIVENVERMGLANVVITSCDLEKYKSKLLGLFDKVILDAPCSGSGMFRKDKKMEDDWSYNKVLKFKEEQKRLIILAYQLLASGGTMVYSTCSFSYEEDEEIIKYLLESTDAIVLPIQSTPYVYQDKCNPYGFHTFPNLFPGEGHYICLIKKPGELPYRRYPRKEDKLEMILRRTLKYPIPLDDVVRFGNFAFATPQKVEAILSLPIIRYGLKIAEIEKDVVKYNYHYSHYLNKFYLTQELDDEELDMWLQGLTIPSKVERGYVLIKYKDVSLSFGKSDGKQIKNHLPKIFRMAYFH